MKQTCKLAIEMKVVRQAATGRWEGSQTGRETGRQTDRQTGR